MNVSFGSVRVTVPNNDIEKKLFNETKTFLERENSKNGLAVHIEEGGKAESGAQDYKIYGKTAKMEENIAAKMKAAGFNTTLDEFEGNIPDYHMRKNAAESININA